jgi:release factor glutamine methyltransferase
VTRGEALAASGLEAREARLLLAAACGIGEAGLIARPEIELTADAEARFVDWAARRRAGAPIAYLLGEREFYGLALSVTPAVLIPRPETELLVDLALERIAAQADCAVLDLGTGSGAIALAVKRHRPRARVTAVDASDAALAVARANAARLGLAVEFRLGRWFAALEGERYELIVANPPYVAAGDPHLEQGDLRFEPRGALVGGADGLDAIRAIAAQAPAHLNPGGWLLVEHGFDQAKAVRACFERAGFETVETRRDLSGNPRVTSGRYR